MNPHHQIRSARAVILAAGFGSRLGAHTAHLHKCLVEVAGQTILARCLKTLRTAGIREVRLVVGHLGAQVRAAAQAVGDGIALTFIENDNVAATGTAYSLLRGLPPEDAGQDLLVIEADVVFAAEALDRLLRVPDVNATLVAPFVPPVSGSAVLCREDGMVRDWLHASHQDGDFSNQRQTARKTVNLTRFSGGEVGKLRLALDRTIAASARSPLEYAMRRLVLEDGVLIRAVDVVDSCWYEVDDAQDLAIAEKLFSGVVAPAR